MMRRTIGLGALLLLGMGLTGCTNLRYLSSDELWAKSDEYFNSGDYDDAIPYYDELLRRNEDDKKALLMRGLSHERTDGTEKALRDYAQAGKKGEGKAILYRANLNIARGDTAAAEEDLGKLRDMGLGGRDQVIQLTLLGTLRLKQGRSRLAAQSLERAIATGKSFADARKHVADAHYNAAQAYYRLGDFGRAYDHMIGYASKSAPAPLTEEELLEKPNAALTGRDYYMLGLLAYLNHDYEAAEVHLGRADAELVERAAKILDDPSFGAKGGLK